ncbi:MAG: hypothetical protein V4489_01230 [Chlamydiota bacterium]
MNKHFFEFLLHSKGPVVSGTDLCHILNGSPDSRYGIVKRSVQEGFLIPIRKDFYLIAPSLHNKDPVDVFAIAPIIYGPSYISFESALSYHGWIPEAVRSITCAHPKKSKEFITPIGIFSYKHIPLDAFSLGVTLHEKKGSTLFIAEPWKALADMIYSNKKTWKTLKDLSSDLRIEKESFEDSDITPLEDLIKDYPSLRVQKALKALQKGFSL